MLPGAATYNLICVYQFHGKIGPAFTMIMNRAHLFYTFLENQEEKKARVHHCLFLSLNTCCFPEGPHKRP